MRKILTLIAFLFLAASVQAAAEKPLVAYTSVTPLASIMQEIGGRYWTVGTLVDKGKDPHTFALTPSIAAELSDARVYLAVGVELDEMVVRRVPKSTSVVNLTDSEEDHEHGEDEHNPHLWLDPDGMLQVASAVCDAFSMKDPSHAAEYKAACESFGTKVRSAASQAQKILAPYKGRSFYVQHDAFGRFAACYGLDQVSLEEHEKEPSAARIAEIIARGRREGVKILYAQPGHDPKQLQVIADSVGAEIATLDPLEPDPVASLVNRAEILAAGFEKEAR